MSTDLQRNSTMHLFFRFAFAFTLMISISFVGCISNNVSVGTSRGNAPASPDPDVTHDPWYLVHRVNVSAPDENNEVSCYGLPSAVNNLISGDKVLAANLTALGISINQLADRSNDLLTNPSYSSLVAEFDVQADGSFNLSASSTCVQAAYGDQIGFLLKRNHTPFKLSAISKYVANYYSRAPQINQLVHSAVDTRFVWVATDQGIYYCADFMTRLDDCVHLDSRNGLVSNRVTVLLENSDGSIWAGTRSGLSLYKNGTFVSYTTKSLLALPNNTITELLNVEGGLWIGTQDGLAYLNGAAITTYAPDPAHRIITQLAADKHGGIWIGIFEGGVFYFNGIDFLHVAPEYSYGGAENNIAHLIVNDDALWAGSEMGLWSFNGIPELSSVLSPVKIGVEDWDGFTISALESTTGGHVWAGIESAPDGYGLLRYSNDGTLKRRYTAELDGLAANSISTILELSSGDVLVGTPNGLNRMRDLNVSNLYTVNENLFNNSILQLAQGGGDSTFWVGTTGGLNYFDGAEFSKLDVMAGLPTNNVNQVLISSHTRLNQAKPSIWIGTDGGVVEYACTLNPNRCAFSEIEQNGGGHVVVKGTRISGVYGNSGGLLESQSGEIFAVTSDNKLLRFDSTALYFNQIDFEHGVINRAIDGPNDKLWIATNDGVYLVAKTEPYTTAALLCELPSLNAKDIFKAADNSVWIGTTGGLVHVIGNDCSTYTTVTIPALPNNTINRITQASDGTIYVATDSGQNVAYFNKPDENGGTINGNIHLTNDPAPAIVHLLTGTDGSLWVGYAISDALKLSVARYKDGSVHFYSVTEGLPEYRVTALKESAKGEIWIATVGPLINGSAESGGIAVFDPTHNRFSNTIYSADTGLPDNHVLSIAQSLPSGQIWIGTQRGISVLLP